MGAQTSSFHDGLDSDALTFLSEDTVPAERDNEHSVWQSIGCWSGCNGCNNRLEVQDPTGTLVREAGTETEEASFQLTIHPALASRFSTRSPFTGSSPSAASRSRGSSASDEASPKSRTSAQGSWYAENGSYDSAEALAESLKLGEAVLVWGSWLAEFGSSKGRVLPRRDELPPEAICDPKEVAAGTPLLAVSYCWASSGHPDPEGQQLRVISTVLKKWIQWLRTTKTTKQGRHSKARSRICFDEEFDVHDVFGIDEEEPHRQDSSCTPHNEAKSHDVAVLLDWCSMYQEPRSPKERIAAERALRQVGRWFAHEQTKVWLLTRSPLGAQPYNQRGWPTFERAVSFLSGSCRKEVLDLGLAGDELEKLLEQLEWPDFACRCRAHRFPAPTPRDFALDLRSKSFSWGRDRIILEDRYGEVFEDLVGNSDSLAAARQGWGDEHMDQLVRTLSCCTNLQRLELCHNRIGYAGAAKLAQGLGMCRQLRQLDLMGNEIGDIGASCIAAGLKNCRIVVLGLESNFIGDSGVGQLAEVLPSWSNLRYLLMGRNEIGDTGAGQLAVVMPRCASLEILDLSENEVGDVGAERLAAVLPGCEHLQRFDLARNRVGDLGALRLAAALPRCPQLQAFGLGGHEVGEILGGGRIGDGGAGLLASAFLRCERLSRLDLSENQIGDGGITQLAAAIPHCGRLAELDLCRNCIADGGAGKLAEAVSRCSRLDWLRLLGNPLGNSGEQRLLEAWRAAGKPEGRLLCRTSSTLTPSVPSVSSGLSFGAGLRWSWGRPSIAPQPESAACTATGPPWVNNVQASFTCRTKL